MEIGKGQFFSYHSNDCLKEKIVHQKHKSYPYKLSMKILNLAGDKERHNLKNVQIEKKDSLLNHSN